MTRKRTTIGTALGRVRERLSALNPSTNAEEATLYECRHCGTAFDEEPEDCSDCGATAIATYHPSTFQ